MPSCLMGVQLPVALLSALAAGQLADIGASATPSRPQQAQEDAVRGLLRRRLPAHADSFELHVVAPPTPQAQAFCITAGTSPGRVALTATSGVALASALNHYLKYDAGVQIDVWFTSQTATLPPGMPLPAPTPVNISSPYTFQNYLNVCAFGYSTVWYSW
jgi:alpha-N-acetylglucosaminidase